MAGIERDKLPDLIQAMDILGPLKKEIAAELGLKEGTPSSVALLMCRQRESVQARSETTKAICTLELHRGSLLTFLLRRPISSTILGSFPSPLPGRYLILTEQECAGKCLTWLRDNFLYHKDELMNGGKKHRIF